MAGPFYQQDVPERVLSDFVFEGSDFIVTLNRECFLENVENIYKFYVFYIVILPKFTSIKFIT